MGKTTDVGYGKPPVETRFKTGRSGNPHGRSKGRHNLPPFERVLGRMGRVKQDGVDRHIRADEAFVALLVQRGLQGDAWAAQQAAEHAERARAGREAGLGLQLPQVILEVVAPGTVNAALEPLRMATKLDRYRPSARMKLEPWLVQAALARLGDRRLTLEEQESVVRAVRTPGKVRWPDWWEVTPAP